MRESTPTSHETARSQNVRPQRDAAESPTAPENANALPGGGLNTAGGNAKEASIIDAARTIHLADFKEVHKKPCVRDALMTGIGVGFSIGGVRSILGGA